MRLTWVGHSALRVQHDGFTAVIDPGGLSTADAAADADAVLISHEHLDHYDETRIAAAAAHPGLQIWTNTSVARLLADSGAARGARVRVVGHGDVFDVGGLEVQVHGEWHAPIHPDIPRVRNSGFLIDGRLFHPGDAMTDPGVPIDLLLVPLHGFYTRSGATVDYIRQLKPARVAPIHDATLTTVGQTGVDAFLAQNPPPGPGTGSPYQRVPLGQSIEY
ncbi:MBL fold metallo-hydrolase [Kutzneria sp. NPDC051319]|uniref:MBL fold metallo-hydrolase n=1 Tax=Kutzneria sp. NPDC051319 TaxID=3155047 RepID=UPI0034295A76